jgi:hypothetical protein
MNFDDESLKKHLSDIPDIPKAGFEAVETRLKQRAFIIKSSYISAAAAILVTIALYSGFLKRPHYQAISVNTSVVSSDVSVSNNSANEELNTAYQFINGSNIETEISDYALADNVIY